MCEGQIVSPINETDEANDRRRKRDRMSRASERGGLERAAKDGGEHKASPSGGTKTESNTIVGPTTGKPVSFPGVVAYFRPTANMSPWTILGCRSFPEWRLERVAAQGPFRLPPDLPLFLDELPKVGGSGGVP